MDDNPITDDNINVNEEVAPAEPQNEAPTQEIESSEAPQETEEPEVPEVPEVPEPGQKPEEGQPSRREALRIQNLLKKYGPPKENQAPSKPDALNYSEALDADEEVIKRLEADRNQVGESSYTEGLKRAEYLNWNTGLKIDAPKIESKYDILNPDKPEAFHPQVADTVNSFYLNMVGFDSETQTVANPNIGYAEFVEGFMELVQETAGERNAASVKNIAKQAANTAIRPDGSSAKPSVYKDPSEMSIEELYAAIGQKPPKN
jgi:hypothetical protein